VAQFHNLAVCDVGSVVRVRYRVRATEGPLKILGD